MDVPDPRNEERVEADFVGGGEGAEDVVDEGDGEGSGVVETLADGSAVGLDADDGAGDFAGVDHARGYGRAGGAVRVSECGGEHLFRLPVFGGRAVGGSAASRADAGFDLVGVSVLAVEMEDQFELGHEAAVGVAGNGDDLVPDVEGVPFHAGGRDGFAKPSVPVGEDAVLVGESEVDEDLGGGVTGRLAVMASMRASQSIGTSDP